MPVKSESLPNPIPTGGSKVPTAPQVPSNLRKYKKEIKTPTNQLEELRELEGH